MRMFFSYCLPLSLLITLYSCEKNLEPGVTENKIVVLAEITAGDTAFIPIGKSNVTRTGTAINFEKIINAGVSVFDENNNVRTLHYNSNPMFLENPMAVYSGIQVFEYNKAYTLRVTHPLLKDISATTRIPAPFAVSGVRTEESEANGKNVLVFDFTIHDNAAEKNYYIFEAVKQLVDIGHYFFWQGRRYDYDTPEGEHLHDSLSSYIDIDILMDTLPKQQFLRLNIFTFDKTTDNNSLGSLDSSFHRIFLTDSLFNGRTYSSFFMVSSDYFEAKTDDQIGKVLIRIKSVSKELYDYLLGYEQYRTNFEVLPVQQLSSPKGNIQNGLGVFGGTSKREWIFYYDDFD